MPFDFPPETGSGVPPGYEPLARRSPYVDLIGPLYTRGTGQDLSLALRVEAKHCNSRGLLHGGVISTLSDMALGYAAVLGADPPLQAVTSSLHVDYIEPARIGSWIASRLETAYVARGQVFASGSLASDGKVIARVHATFAIRRPA